MRPCQSGEEDCGCDGDQETVDDERAGYRDSVETEEQRRHREMVEMHHSVHGLHREMENRLLHMKTDEFMYQIKSSPFGFWTKIILAFVASRIIFTFLWFECEALARWLLS